MARVRETAGIVRREVEDIRALLFMRFPFLAVLLRRVRIVLSNDTETVCVTTAGELVLNPSFWQGLRDFETKTFVLLHEALHLGFRHPWYSRGRNLAAYNMAADMVVNETLLKHGLKKPVGRKLVTAESVRDVLKDCGTSVSITELKKASAEEVYRLLCRSETVQKICDRCDNTGLDLADVENPDGLVVQEGGMSGGEEPERYWREAMAEALVTANQAGTLPGETKRLAEASLRPRIDWRLLLQAGLQEGTWGVTVNTWRHSSRRYACLPGVKRLGLQTVRALVDCSGSISQDTLNLFLSEVCSLARTCFCRVSVLPWDARAYPSFAANTPARVKDIAARRLYGGGGTVLKPALETLKHEMSTGDIVVILSDGYIDDIRESSVLKLYRRLAARAGRMIFVTTGNKPLLPDTKIIVLE